MVTLAKSSNFKFTSDKNVEKGLLPAFMLSSSAMDLLLPVNKNSTFNTVSN